MGDLSKNGVTSIMHLPDDCLTIIFHALDNRIDRESFGLTCRRWLHIQDFNRRSLQFECSFTILNPSSLSTKSLDVHTVHLHRLLRRFQHLESLSLCGCRELNDSGLTRLLSYGSNLQKLNLDCCLKVTDYGLSLVASGCPSLTTISLYRCLNITDKGLETLATACQSLKYVNLSYCSHISDNGLKAIAQRCCQLQAVNISHCESINGVGFKGCSKSLAHVEAESCKLTPEGVMGIVSGGGIEYLDVSCLSWSPLGDPLHGIGFSSSLKILNFRMCRTVSDTSIAAIAKGCPLLKEWNLALCHEVRISGWQAVGLYCQNLKRLHVNRCRNLNDNGLQALRDGCRSLSILYLNGCVRVTPFALELFKSHRANVCIKEEEVMCIKPYYSPFR
ncbi:F-box/LRR-repeat protein 12 [Cicer arietinum]|uniref:F-box/LRR-repeat protein 12 n=1 Tax=Cicer arietinum TaxID=3827 RepID=A0A1S2YVT2_CICAR|nr:F-box/LRR-repeat protein 12 [Cicer arietinum]XP_004510721.1 F-box/LRR-repeat protein 12 [Cicer arietinum]XP_004510722.1 F-box/LRR-repeat protein 12 [Cicer arietinum]